jgi:molecular chaperone HscB
MDDPHTKTHPVMCQQCSQPMDSPVCCAGCGALNPLPPSMFTYFELFGIQPTFDVDTAELRRKYLTLSRSIHPDVAAGRDSDKVRKQSLALSSGLNRAYETLRNPTARAEYLLTLAGGPSAATDKSVAGELLGEVMLLREEIEEARQANNQAALTSLRGGIRERSDRTLAEIAGICRKQLLADPKVQLQLRGQLNAIKYWNNLLDQIPTEVEA